MRKRKVFLLNLKINQTQAAHLMNSSIKEYHLLESFINDFSQNHSIKALEEKYSINALKHFFEEQLSINYTSFFKAIHPLTLRGQIQAETPSLFDDEIQTENEVFEDKNLITLSPFDATEIQNGFKNTSIQYEIYSTVLGYCIIGNTSKGICFVSFEDLQDNLIQQLKSRYSNATFVQEKSNFQEQVLHFLVHQQRNTLLPLQVAGTDFQLKAWKGLLQIPLEKLITYQELANLIGNPKATRAVGTAIGQNPVAQLIPCHRVINATGEIGKFRWGTIRKKIFIGLEGASMLEKLK